MVKMHDPYNAVLTMGDPQLQRPRPTGESQAVQPLSWFLDVANETKLETQQIPNSKARESAGEPVNCLLSRQPIFGPH